MNILHLSDIHFGRNYSCNNIKGNFQYKTQILRELISCVSKIEKPLRPEHIIVTGDIVWTGCREEYNEAIAWFKELLKATGLSGCDITFCPGNHDANRKHLNYQPNINNHSIKEIDNLYEYSCIHKLESCFYEYNRFCEEIGAIPYAYPVEGHLEYSYGIGYKDIVSSSMQKIRIISFNTALLSSLPQISPDQMWIGQPQVRDLLNYGIIPTKGAVHYTIALFHHAERFLHPNELCEYDGRVATLPLLRKNVDLLLCGHTETGGKPILYQQIGGGILLTAGATYYSDDHPNAFSVLHIASNTKKMCFSPYVYDKNWRKYPNTEKIEVISDIYDLPEIGTPLENCSIIVECGTEQYILPVKRLSRRLYTKNGEKYIKLDNREEVLRYFDIVYEGAINGGKATLNVSLSPKMLYDVQAALRREEFFSFIGECKKRDEQAQLKIINSEGIEIASSSSGLPDCCGDEQWIKILSCISKIESFFDVKCRRPDNISQEDLHRINILLKLISDGYLDCFSVLSPMEINITSKQELITLQSDAKKSNAFYLHFKNDYECELFGTKISLKDVSVFAGPYHTKRVDMLFKSLTYRDGDTRKCILKPSSDIRVYFILDQELAESKISLSEIWDKNLFTSNSKNINFDFIHAVQ